MDISIEKWAQPLDNWPELGALVGSIGQTRWVENSYFDWHLGRYLYVAVADRRPVGYLLMIIQNIGDDEKHDRFELAGSFLREAKVLAFGVPPALRGNGIGRKLQNFAMARALDHGCHQFRSRSDGDAIENHALKTKMGFAIHPANRPGDRRSAFFVMPLGIWSDHVKGSGGTGPDGPLPIGPSTAIAEWGPSSQGWDELVSLVESLDQSRWVFDTDFDWHLERHLYVATSEGKPVGYILVVIQYIGDDDDHDRFELDGAYLKEAKVLAFGVPPELRRAGIGRRLQRVAMAQAVEHGCYQFRSRSDGPAVENHILKTKMGFAIHPAARGDDNKSAYFVMPLRIWRESS